MKSLTKSEITKILLSMDHPISMYQFARNIQQALKEKNYGAVGADSGVIQVDQGGQRQASGGGDDLHPDVWGDVPRGIRNRAKSVPGPTQESGIPYQHSGDVQRKLDNTGEE